MYKIESYDQRINSLVKNNILESSIIYFNDINELLIYHCLRYNIQKSQIDIDKDNNIKLLGKLGETFAIIGKILKY